MVVGYDTRMNQFIEWLPLLAFFVVFKTVDIYWATGTLMLTCTLQMFVHRFRTGRFKPMHVVTVAVVVLLGGATLFLHDKRFIQLKPTILLGVTAVAFLGSAFVGQRTLAQRMLEGAFPEPLTVSTRAWQVLNLLWTGWFAILAAANLYVAHNFTEAFWVNFKVFGISAGMIVFMIPKVLWLASRNRPAEPGGA